MAQGLPPIVLCRPEFLPRDVVGQLLNYALANEGRFGPSPVYSHDSPSLNPSVRRSLRLRDTGTWAPLFREALAPLAPEFAAGLNIAPFELKKMECELVAHGDAAFFVRHTDDHREPAERSRRILSAVYYFHRLPKAFQGGSLRLHRHQLPDGFLDIDPDWNSLAVFSSSAAHEVTPITLRSKQFADCRFSFNCWLYGPA